MERSDSVRSFTSDQLEEEDNSVEMTFQEAPFDIIGQHEAIGDVIVAKEGTPLPFTSKYFKKDGSAVAVKFAVSSDLDVTVVSERSLSKQPSKSITRQQDLTYVVTASLPTNSQVMKSPQSSHVINHDLNLEFDSSITNVQSGVSPSVIMNKESTNNVGTVDQVHEDLDASNASDINANGTADLRRFRGVQEFVSYVDDEFESIIIGGLEAGLRKNVLQKFNNNLRLSKEENMKVIHSINQAYQEQFGSAKPDDKACKALGQLLKDKFPETYRVRTTVKTAYGLLPLKCGKGEGGYGDISKRIGDAFYDRYIRKNIKRPNVVQGENSMVQLKKIKKVYGVSREKWDVDVNASKAEIASSKKTFSNLSSQNSIEENKELLLNAAAYIQSQFKALEPSQAADRLKVIRTDQKLLGLWFEFVTDGSKDGDLTETANMQSTKVFNIVEQYLLSKNCSSYIEELSKIKNTSQVQCGNDIDYRIFLLRELGLLFKNKPEKLVFLAEVDTVNEGPNMQEPYVFVERVNTFGIEEFPEKVVTSLRIGEKVMIKGLSLYGALAACIQLYFVFNMWYPTKADDLCQFVQRFLLNFGDEDGSRNRNGSVKKWYRDFQTFAATILLESNEGELLSIVR